MGAKKDTTRQQHTKAIAPPAKKAKTEGPKKVKSDSPLDAVAEAIQQVEGLTENCRQMLLSTLPGSLGVPADERLDIQKMCVAMIGEALESVEASLRAAVEIEVSRVAAIESSKPSLEEDHSRKQAALTTAAELVQTKKTELSDIANAFLAAKSTLSEAKEAHSKGEAALAGAMHSKDAIDGAIQVDLKAVLEGTSEESQLKSHYESLAPILSNLTLESSFVIALPSTCAKLKANRGPFDDMVLEQLENTMMSKAAELAKLLEQGGVSTQTCVAAVEAAEKEVEVTGERQKCIGEALTSFMSSEKEAAVAACDSGTAVVAFEIDCEKAVHAREAKIKVLDHFKEHNMGSFTSLRDKLSKQAVAAAEIEAAAEVEAAAAIEAAIEIEAAPIEAAIVEITAQPEVPVGGA